MYPELLVCVFSYSYTGNPPTAFSSHVKLKLKKKVLWVRGEGCVAGKEHRGEKDDRKDKIK